MDFAESVAYLSSLKRFGVRPGLARIRALLDELGNPQDRWPSIHIGGTNGKGSVTTFCASILSAAGFKVGRYHSPYVFDIRERIMIGNEMIPEDEFARLMTRIVPVAEGLDQEELGPVTEFELKTAVAFRYFADAGVAMAAVEVGLGGRLDATNAILPRVAAVTNVGLDHTEILGETVREIAREKGGIIKPGTRFVTAAEDPDALEVLSGIAWEMMAGLTHVRHARGRAVVQGRSAVWWEDGGLHIRTPRVYLRGLEVGLLGPHQRTNATLAVAAVESFADSYGIDVPADAYITGLRDAWLPGRMQIVGAYPRVILDGAHNRDAAAVIRTAADELVGGGRLHVVLGMSKGHDPERFLAAIVPISGSLILTQPSDARGLPLERLSEAAEELGLLHERAGTVREGVEAALRGAAETDTILVTGSFYTVHDCEYMTANPAN